MKLRSKLFAAICLSATPFLLGGCSQVMTAVKKADLHVETSVNEGIFLSPVAPKDIKAYVRVRNTTDKKMMIETAVKMKLKENGVVIVDSPNDATHSIDVGILKIGRQTPEDYTTFQAGYGGLVGAVAGVAANLTKPTSAAKFGMAGWLIGTGVDFIADMLIDDIYINMIADIQISERNVNDKAVNASCDKALMKKPFEWKPHKTRVMTTANQVNLTIENATAAMENSLAKAIAGFL